jgi:subtilisin family serine protease
MMSKNRRQRFLMELLETRLTMAADMAGTLQPTPLESLFEVSTIEWQGRQVEVKAGSWLVSLKEDASTDIDMASLVRQRITSLAPGPVETVFSSHSADAQVTQRALGNRQWTIQTPAAWGTETVYQSLASLPGVRYAEPDFIVRATGTLPNDPSIDSMYALENAGIYEAWDSATGSSNVVVGVIDSGVDYTHPDLVSNMWRNPGEIPGDGRDNDRNGFIDDVYGYDFLNGDGDPMDDRGHGTHVAGTIAATGNNGIGVAGVSWNAKIMALKFLGSNGSGPTSAAVAALNYATTMKTAYGVNIRITNNSWGGGAYSQTMADALVANANAGMLFVAAAGNAASDNDALMSYPSSYSSPNVISVASSTNADTLSSFSNYGATSVDIAAPGSNIYSTTLGGSYGTMSGTSMASPQVAGAAALLLGEVPNATYQQVRDAIYQGVDLLPAFAGKVATQGRLNVSKSLNQLLGDVGDTLVSARTTSLDQNGDRFLMHQSRIGDGPHASQDVDIYRIQATAGDRLTAELAAMANGLDGNRILRLFDASGSELALVDDPNTHEAVLNFEFTNSGVYFVGVSSGLNTAYSANQANSGVGTIATDYRLHMSLDVGDLLSTAKPLSLPTPGSSYQYHVKLGDGVQGNADVDLYRVTLTAGTVLNAFTKPKIGGEALTAVLRLFDGAGNQVAISAPSGPDNASLSYRAIADGAYYLGISGAGNEAYSPVVPGSGTEGDIGDYSLSISTSRTTPETDAEFDLHGLLGGDGSRGFVMNGKEEYAELTAPTASRHPWRCERGWNR